jgi:hypothetical protein
MLEIEMLAMKSWTTPQLAPPFVLFQIPPPTLPQNRVVVVAGFTASDRTRPPMFPGPSSVQLAVFRPPVVSSRASVSTCVFAAIIAPCGMLPFSSRQASSRHSIQS